MARKRMADNPNELQSWADVDNTLKSIREIEIEIGAIEARMDLNIIDIKQKASEQITPLVEQMESAEKKLKKFAKANQDDMDGKTKEMNFGKLGFRKSTKVVISNANKAIERLKALKLVNCIITKEKIDRTEIAKLTDEQLADIGARKPGGDVFWYETAKETLTGENE